MIETLAVCDLCQKPGPIKVSIKEEGTAERWDVCHGCYHKPFRRPSPADKAEARAELARTMLARAGQIFTQEL